MKLSILYATTAAAALTFQIMTLRSGTPYQGGRLGLSSGQVVYAGGSEIKWVLNDDGSLADKNSKKYLTVEDGWFVFSDTAEKTFSLDADRLAYNDEPSFGICPDDHGRVQFNGTCSDYTGVALQAVGKKFSFGYHPDRFHWPGEEPESSSASESPHTTIAKREPTNAGGAIYDPLNTNPASIQEPKPKNGEEFSLTVSKNRGWFWHWTKIKKFDLHPHVYSLSRKSGKEVKFLFQDDGKSLTDSDGRDVIVRDNGEMGEVAPDGHEKALPYFDVKNGYLLFNGDSWWWACPNDVDDLYVSKKECENGKAFNFRVR